MRKAAFLLLFYFYVQTMRGDRCSCLHERIRIRDGRTPNHRAGVRSPPSGEEGLRLCGNGPDPFRLIIGKKNREERIPVLHLTGKRDRVGEGGLYPEGIHLQRDPVHAHIERRDMPLRIEGGDDGDRRDRLIIKGCIGWETGHAASFLYGTPCKKIIGTHVRFVNRTKYEITKRNFF